MQIRELSVPGYERVVRGMDESAGYHGFIFVHSTALGPAVGGTRFWHYQDEHSAINDGLRLSRGMTYKNALAGLPVGGGKAIIMRQSEKPDREKLFRAHGTLVLHGFTSVDSRRRAAQLGLEDFACRLPREHPHERAERVVGSGINCRRRIARRVRRNSSSSPALSASSFGHDTPANVERRSVVRGRSVAMDGRH